MDIIEELLNITHGEMSILDEAVTLDKRGQGTVKYPPVRKSSVVTNAPVTIDYTTGILNGQANAEIYISYISLFEGGIEEDTDQDLKIGDNDIVWTNVKDPNEVRDFVKPKKLTDLRPSRIMHMLHQLDIKVGQVGSTVRLGNRWADSLGSRLILCVCSDFCKAPNTCNDPKHNSCGVCDRQGTGKVVDVWTGVFQDIPARLIHNEHEESSRLYPGLVNSMKKAYGDRFDETKVVTVVSYRRDS